jgi:alpha-tubulin suppressor-like RCC1 family protein
MNHHQGKPAAQKQIFNLFAFLVTLTGCTDATIRINPKTANVAIDAVQILTVVSSSDSRVEWSISPPEAYGYLSPSPNRTASFSADVAGTYKITVSSGTASDFATVTVVGSGNTSLKTLSIGADHTCGLAPNGQAYCWGGNGSGQLGDGQSQFIDRRSVPKLVAGDLRFSSISSGSSHTCAVTTDHQAYCWGFNYYGALGDGTTMNKNKPVAVSGNLKFLSIGAGNLATCALSLEGQTYCWGFNNEGKLGDGTTTNRLVPTLVSGDIKFSNISVGWYHSCGLTADGQAYCWGRNSSQKLDDGTTTNAVVPTAVTGGPSFVSIGTGENNTCAIAANAQAYCWGENSGGELGTGLPDYYRATPRLVASDFRFSDIRTSHNLICGIAVSNGRAYCWGHNELGQVGDGSTLNRIVPTLVSGNLNFSSINTSNKTACGLTPAGQAYCWGSNFNGKLGDETFDPSRGVPTRVSPLP